MVDYDVYRYIYSRPGKMLMLHDLSKCNCLIKQKFYTWAAEDPSKVHACTHYTIQYDRKSRSRSVQTCRCPISYVIKSRKTGEAKVRYGCLGSLTQGRRSFTRSYDWSIYLDYYLAKRNSQQDLRREKNALRFLFPFLLSIYDRHPNQRSVYH